MCILSTLALIETRICGLNRFDMTFQERRMYIMHMQL